MERADGVLSNSSPPGEATASKVIVAATATEGQLVQRVVDVGSGCFAHLYHLPYEARKSMRNKKGDDVLSKRSSVCFVDWRQFGLQHCPGLIRSTGFEGGCWTASIVSVQKFLSLYSSSEQRFFQKGPIGTEVQGKIKNALNQLVGFLIPHKKSACTDQQICDEVERVFEKIQDGLQGPSPTNVFYLPLGYLGGKMNDGHAVVGKVEIREENVVFSFFNLGNGCDLHPSVDLTANQRKRSFTSFPITIPKVTFFGDIGKAAWGQLLRYNLDPIEGTEEPRDGYDLYDILYQLSFFKKDPRSGKHSNLDGAMIEYGQAEQVSGNCSEVAVRNTIEDVLICSGVSRNDRRLFFLNRDFSSLVSAYHNFFNDGANVDSAISELLHDAAKSFGVALFEASRDELVSDEELFGAQTAVHKILKLVKRHQQDKSVVVVASAAEASVSNVLTEFTASLPPASAPALSQAEEALVSTISMAPPSFDINTFSQTILSWIRIAESLSGTSAFAFVADCMRTLPVPSREEGDIWGRSTDMRMNLIVRLKRLINEGLKGVSIAEQRESYNQAMPAASFTEQFLTIYTAYAIVDRLARGNPEARLRGYASPFLPHFIKEPNGFTSLPLKEDNERYRQLKSYFTGRDSNSAPKPQEKVVFPVAQHFLVSQYLASDLAGSDVTDTKEHLQEIHHLEYVRQFSDGLSSNASIICSQWVNPSIAPEVQHLYFFVFLSQSLFFGSPSPGKGEKFPNSLSFSTEINNGQYSVKTNLPLFEASRREGALPLRERRFAENGIEDSMHDRGNSKFHRLYASDTRDLTTNKTVFYPVSSTDTSELRLLPPLIRAILDMTRTPALGPWKVVQTFCFPYTLSMLSNPWVQQAIDSCLFHPSVLLSFLEHTSTSLVVAVRDFIKQGLKWYDDGRNVNMQSVVLFLLRIGISFETYTESSNREGILNDYRAVLKNLLARSRSDQARQEVLLYRAFLEATHSDTSRIAPMQLFPLLFSSRLNDLSQFSEYHPRTNSTSWLIAQLPRFIRSNAYKFHAEFDSDQRNSICQAIIEKSCDHFKSDLPHGDWSGRFPSYTCGDFVVDFLEGRVSHKKFGTLTRLNYAKDSRFFLDKTIFESIGSLFWEKGDGSLRSLCGKISYCATNKKWFISFKKSATLEQVETFSDWPELEKGPIAFLGNPSLGLVHIRKDGTDDFISYDVKTRSPYMHLRRSGNILTFIRERSLTEGPIHLANLENLSPNDPLYRITTVFARPCDMLCFVNADKKIEELNFFSSKLLFVKDSSNQELASSEFHGFYLVDDLFSPLPKGEKASGEYSLLQEELNKFKNALVLYNPQKKEWRLLLPAVSLKVSAETFSKDVSSDDSKSRHGYYFYEFDPIKRLFYALPTQPGQAEAGGSERAHIHLSMLFKMQRDYNKALHYLSNVKIGASFDTNILEALCQLRYINDSSPASIAFNMKLSLLVINNKNLMTEEQFDHKAAVDSAYHSFVYWAIRSYYLYLHLTDEGKEKLVPESLRITQGEKKTLLLGFRQFYQKLYGNEENKLDGKPRTWEERWENEQFILANQYNLFFSKKETVTFNHTQTLPIHPPILLFKEQHFGLSAERLINDCLSMVFVPPLQKYPIRVSYDTLVANFFNLYEQARLSSKDLLSPFDFTLHALLKAKPNVPGAHFPTPLALLLLRVRHNPEHFSSFSLANVPREMLREHIGTIQQIIEVANSLPPIDFGQYVKMPIRDDLVLKKELPSITPEKIDLRLGEEAGGSALGDTPCLTQIEKAISKLFYSFYHVRGGVLSRVDEAREELLFELERDCNRTFGKDKYDGSLPEVIMKEVIMKDDGSFLTKHRPMLTKEEKIKLCRLVCEWYHAQVLLKLPSEQYLHYDPFLFPEISYFFAKTGKFPRKEQLETYQWVCDKIRRGQSVHFQLAAGGGKTDLLTPLFNLAAKRLGRMPISCVTQSAYPIDKRNLAFNLKILNEHLGYLEIGLHMIKQLTAKDLLFIFTQLKQYKREGRGLIITRYTFDAIFLAHDFACITAVPKGFLDSQEVTTLDPEIEDRILWSHRILQFFQEETLLICDESHQNLDALTRSIISMDTTENITNGGAPVLHTRLARGGKTIDFLLFDLMEPLLGINAQCNVVCQDGKKAFDVAHLFDSFKGAPSNQEVKYLQEALKIYIDDKWPNKRQPARLLKGVREQEKSEELTKRHFLLQEKKRETEAEAASWLEAERLKQGIINHFLYTILPDILKMRTDIDHTRSFDPSRMYDIPAHNGLASTAEYEDFYKTFCLSIKGYYERGLSKEDLLIMFREEQTSNQQSTTTMDHSNFNTSLQEWLKTSEKYRNYGIGDIDTDDSQMMDELFELLHRHSDCIKAFLLEYTSRAIGSSSYQLSCSPVDFFENFLSISFSATPRDVLSYPRKLTEDNFRVDTQFTQKIRSQLRAKIPSDKLVVIEGVISFFEEMKQANNSFFQRATALIDPRGFFAGDSNRSVAEKWMKYNDSLNAVLFFSETSSDHVDRQQKFFLLTREGQLFELEGTNVKDALKKYQLCWEDMKIGTLYDSQHTEATHIVQKNDALALFFVAEGLTYSQLLQSIMRMRGFLEEQEVVFIYHKELADKIFSPSAPKNIEAILEWTKTNERVQEQKRIILNAMAEISFVVAKKARQAMGRHHQSNNMISVVSTFRQYMNGLVDVRNLTSVGYLTPNILQDTKEVLERFASIQYEAFRYQEREYDPDINSIIGRAADEVSWTPSNLHSAISREVQQTCVAVNISESILVKNYTSSAGQEAAQAEQEEEAAQAEQEGGAAQAAKETENTAIRKLTDPTSVRFIQHRNGDGYIYQNSFLDLDRESLQEVFLSTRKGEDICAILSQDQGAFTYGRNQCVCDSNEHDENRKFFANKPTHFFVITIPKIGSPCVNGLAQEEIPAIIYDMTHVPQEAEDPGFKAFVVSSRGELVCKGTSVIDPTEEAVNHILRSDWLQEIILDNTLVQGDIPERGSKQYQVLLSRLKKIGQGWKGVMESLLGGRQDNDSSYSLKNWNRQSSISSTTRALPYQRMIQQFETDLKGLSPQDTTSVASAAAASASPA
ncbi:hypothetical protein JYU14_02490 [Simkania negevensis]|uniref:Uncharacterized protein n=1 Tax=Simkania negevensis TaxID=83561 RepID=A0ABS3ARI7_9BACT|nr:hypothetical protein [Simkania negevensis]